MKARTFALTLIAAAFAAGSAFASPASALADVVAQLEARYPGKVIAIALDTSGDKAAHYHVDMRFPESGLARVDVDATTLALAARDRAPLARGAATLAEATALVSRHVSGQITAVALDTAAGAPAHYDIDIRLPRGAVAQLKVEPVTRAIAWRVPAIVQD